ncbi:hypothetical protein [uncultured Desulfosarcina sp.]|uniref:hypothetical protein n=1 Tax=uncultured Desulfosarcina sp. TaxID=218289 RepID=UPI0029C8D4B3|nr:hypothetical protein [uncultured Desulfosarcina sp.]
MSITPKQFKEIFRETLRDELENFVTKTEFNEKHNDVINAVENVSKKLDTIETELASNQVAHDRFDKRLTRLEAHVGLEPLNA